MTTLKCSLPTRSRLRLQTVNLYQLPGNCHTVRYSLGLPHLPPGYNIHDHGAVLKSSLVPCGVFTWLRRGKVARFRTFKSPTNLRVPVPLLPRRRCQCRHHDVTVTVLITARAGGPGADPKCMTVFWTLQSSSNWTRNASARFKFWSSVPEPGPGVPSTTSSTRADSIWETHQLEIGTPGCQQRQPERSVVPGPVWA